MTSVETSSFSTCSDVSEALTETFVGSVPLRGPTAFRISSHFCAAALYNSQLTLVPTGYKTLPTVDMGYYFRLCREENTLKRKVSSVRNDAICITNIGLVSASMQCHTFLSI
jgi:hypothetical protein